MQCSGTPTYDYTLVLNSALSSAISASAPGCTVISGLSLSSSSSKIGALSSSSSSGRDAGSSLSAISLAQSALTAAGDVHGYARSALNRAGEVDTTARLERGRLTQNTASGLASRGNQWISAGISNLSGTGVAAADGTYAYATYGQDLSVKDGQVFGYTVGLEQGTVEYQSESDVEKLGLSVGAYGARYFGDVTLTGVASLARFSNDYTSTTSATASASSLRAITSLEISGMIPLKGEERVLRPYGQVSYFYEDMEGYTYSDGTVIGETSVSFGEIRIGGEVRIGAPTEGQFIARADISQSLEADDIQLSGGSTYSFTDQESINLSLGYQRDGEKIDSRIELGIRGLGDEDREEISLSGTLERQY